MCCGAVSTLGWDDDEGVGGELPGAEHRRQMMGNIDAPQIIGTVRQRGVG